MKTGKILLIGLLFGQITSLTPFSTPLLAQAETPSPLAQFVRELRADDSFGIPNPHDWEGTLLNFQGRAEAGDQRARAALAAVPAYVAYQNQLAGRRDLTNDEATRLFQLALPIHSANLPADLNPLSIYEAMSINFYTAKTYLILNDDINRHHGRVRDMPTYVATLDQALSKLPAYDGIVHHVQDMDPGQLKRQRKDHIEQYPYYLSTSSERIGWQGNVRMIIHTHTGRDIQRYSINPQEHEVLISRGVKFQVTRDPYLVDGVYQIEYEEVNN